MTEEVGTPVLSWGFLDGSFKKEMLCICNGNCLRNLPDFTMALNVLVPIISPTHDRVWSCLWISSGYDPEIKIGSLAVIFS